MSKQLEDTDFDAIKQFVEQQTANDTEGTEEEKEQRKGFMFMHYVMCAAADKAKNGKIGNLSGYPTAPNMPESFKMRLEELAPGKYSERRIVQRLKEHFNVEEDEARKLADGDLRMLYFNVCCAVVDKDFDEEDGLDEDDYDLTMSRVVELQELEASARKAKMEEFEKNAVPAADGTKISFDDLEKALEGLDNLDEFLEDE